VFYQVKGFSISGLVLGIIGVACGACAVVFSCLALKK